MAVSKFDHYGLLDVWREVMFESKYHFNQVVGEGAPANSDCPNVYIQTLRDNIAIAMNQAWNMAVHYTGYNPTPIWEDVKLPLKRGRPWQLQTLRIPRRYITAIGQRNSSVIEAAASVIYSDADGDGVDDTATISVATTITNTDEIQVFFQTTDGAPAAANEYYQIRPLTVSISGGNATITGHRSLFVKPSTIWDVPYDPSDPSYQTVNAGDTQTAGDFVTKVDVYRIYNDTSTVATLIADPYWTKTSSLGTDVTFAGIVWLEEEDSGYVRVRENGSCPEYISHMRLYYKSGKPLENSMMDVQLQKALSHLANALMPYDMELPLCTASKNRYQDDRRQSDPIPTWDNPLGSLRGHIYAWSILKQMTLVGGGKVTL